MSKEIEIHLREEVELIDGTKTKVVKMREPTRGDLKFVAKITSCEIEQSDLFLERLAGIAKDCLDDIPACDHLKLQEAQDKLMRGNVSTDPKS